MTVLIASLMLSSIGLIAAQMLIYNLRVTTYEQRSIQALDIADAGINYYLWHLSHNSSDYTDGNVQSGIGPYGPYAHDYYDTNGTKIGQYSLTITPPTAGTTITTVRSVGTVPGLPGSRTVLAQLGQPSFANFLFLSNTQLNFSSTSTTSGPVHSNVGVEFDGTNNGPVTAAQSTYVTNPGQVTHNGVWGSGGPQSQWQYPVPTVDFSKVLVDFNILRTKSQQSGGLYLTGSGGHGFSLVLKSDGTIDVYRVNYERTSGLNVTYLRNVASPTNGVAFSTETLWVSGSGYPGRITIAAASAGGNSSRPLTINIIDNLTYAAQDGSAVIGLVAQNDIFVPAYAPSTLTVNAALLAQNGSVGADTINSANKTSFTLYGAIAQYQNVYGFKTSNCATDPTSFSCSGYIQTTYNFDAHLSNAPPPSFPTIGGYSILNWREQLFNP